MIKVKDHPHDDEDEDLTDFERLQIAAMYQILSTGKATLLTDHLEVVIEY